MSNDSSTGGYLTPAGSPAPAPLEGLALDNFFQGVITGITGMAGQWVRPRWQPVPAITPAVSQDWVAIGVTDREADTNAVEEHASITYDNPDVHYDNPTLTYDMPDFDVIVRNEVLTILCSFYGPNAAGNASLLREGFSVAQNREILQLNNMGYVSASNATPVPSLLNEQWRYRVDISFKIRRMIIRYYPVLDIESAAGTLTTDVSPTTRTFNVTNS